MNTYWGGVLILEHLYFRGPSIAETNLTWHLGSPSIYLFIYFWGKVSMGGQADLELQAGTIVSDMWDIHELVTKTQCGLIGQVWWFISLIPGTQEVEAGGTLVQGQPGIYI